MRSPMAVAGLFAVLALAAGCVSRAGEPALAGTTATTTATTAPRPTAVPPDAAIATEAADILASGDAERFNERICPGTPNIQPVAALGADYAATQSNGIGEYFLPSFGDEVVARLTVRAGVDLMLVLGLDFNTYEWCAYAVEWCPVEFAGLPPFTAVSDRGSPASRELERVILCGR